MKIIIYIYIHIIFFLLNDRVSSFCESSFNSSLLPFWKIHSFTIKICILEPCCWFLCQWNVLASSASALRDARPFFRPRGERAIFPENSSHSEVAVYASSGQLRPSEKLLCNKPPLDFQVYYERVWALSWSWRRRKTGKTENDPSSARSVSLLKGRASQAVLKMCTIQIQNAFTKGF